MIKAPPANETVTKRTITWADLYKLRPDLAPKPDNDNRPQTAATVNRVAR